MLTHDRLPAGCPLIFSALGAAAFFSLGIATAHAVPITVDVIAANWTNAVGSNVQFIDPDGIPGNEEVRWGIGQDDGPQSGLRYASAAPPSFTVETGDQFTLGDLTHINNPIAGGTELSSVQLDLTTELTIDGVSLSEGPFNFSFLVSETPNVEPCPFPSTTPCSDRIAVTNLVTSDSFLVNGQPFTLLLDGFSVDGGAVTEFITQEGQENTAGLLGRFDPLTVPEPSTLALLGVGLLGAAALARQRVIG